MKELGVIGGVGPESTIEYYRVLIAAYREQHQDGSYPPILINSINLKTVVDRHTPRQHRRGRVRGSEAPRPAKGRPLRTRFTMQGRFYPDVFSPAGIALVTRGTKIPFLDTTAIHARRAVAELWP